MKRRSREPLSAVIIAFNEASRIQSCLDSLEFCDEVLVLDSGSNDGTQSLCRRFGAKVVHQDWLGYGPQKRKAVELARHDWVRLGKSHKDFPLAGSSFRTTGCKRFSGSIELELRR